MNQVIIKCFENTIILSKYTSANSPSVSLFILKNKLCINLWKIEGAFLTPKGITQNSYKSL